MIHDAFCTFLENVIHYFEQNNIEPFRPKKTREQNKNKNSEVRISEAFFAWIRPDVVAR